MRLRAHQCVDLLGRVDVDDARMILRHEASQRLLLFAGIALLVLLTTASSAKSRKPRRWPATKVPPDTGPVIVTVISKYPDDKRVYHDASTGCNDCGNAREGLDHHRPDERYVVYPKKYEDFVSRKNARHASRYRRYIALAANASDDLAAVERGASEPSTNGSKGKLKKVTLYNDWHKRVKSKETRGNAGRARRSVAIDGDRQSRRNASDYYAQRRAVMERYYARQREINARYAANRTSHGDDAPRGVQPPATRNATLFGFGREYLNGLLNATAGSGAAFRRSSVTIDPLYSRENDNGRSIAIRLNSGQNVVPEVGRGLRFDRGNTSLDHYTTPATCANAPLAGTFAPKARSKQTGNCADRGDQAPDGTTAPAKDENVGSDRQRWGECTGKVVYQHNLLLGLRGPGIFDTMFEVMIQGPVCITCAETLRYNQTRAEVTLESGGRGHEYAKFRLRGYQNEGFSYIIKIWGVKKSGEDCGDL